MRRLLVFFFASAVFAVACGDDDGGITPPSETATPGIGSHSPGTPSSPVEGTIDLAFHQPLMTIFGADTGDYFNDLPLLVAGDVNDDGFDDLLIGARFGDGAGNGREDSGEAYLSYGEETLPQTLDLADEPPGVTIYGAAAGDQLGYHGTLADLNADGAQDIIVTAPFAEDGFGAVYVFFGGDDLPEEIDLSSTEADVTLIGPQRSSFFGDAVSAGDFNGDGINDLLVGATFARRPADLQNPGAQAGAAYVFFGSEDLAGTIDTSGGNFAAAIFGENDDPHPDELGDNVWGADINGDGFGDIIMTAEAADGPDNERSVAAEVHILFGSSEIGGVYDIAAGDQDVSIIGAEQNDTLGFQLAAGDVNGDGIADIFASARGADGPDNVSGESGEVHIVYGREGLPEIIDLLNDESDAYLYGSTPAAMLGYSIGVTDFDGDGSNELVIGSGFAEEPADRANAGALYILDASALSGAVEITEAPLELVISGAEADDALGSAATAGDLNGDGSIEIITLALRADGPDNTRMDAGEIYVIAP